jgi:AraC family transcriptional regulator
MAAADDQRQYEVRLLRVLAYIHDNIDGDLSLDALADVAAMSRFHWHRVFRAMTGETLADAIRRIRLLRAANALVLENAPIQQIAERFGYPNLASFSRAFSVAHGTSPGAFRQRGTQIANELLANPGVSQMYPVTVQDLPPARAAGIFHQGSYSALSGAFQQLGGLIAARSLFPHIRGMIGVYHDAPGSKPDAEMSSHAAVIAAESFPNDIPGLDYFDLAGGKYAVMEHRGPPATLASAYDWLYGKWLPQSGEEPRDAPPIDIYLTDPRTTAPDDNRTNVLLPLV